MSDRPTFESQLRLALSIYAADAPVDVDAVAMATFASHTARAPRSWGVPRRWFAPVMVGIVLVAAVAGALFVRRRST